MPKAPGALANSSVNEPNFGIFSGILGQHDYLAQEFLATVVLVAGNIVVLDVATGPDNVTTTTTADDGAAVGIALTPAAIGARVWVAIRGYALAIAVAANAVGNKVSSSTTAGQYKATAKGTLVAAQIGGVVGTVVVASAGAAGASIVYVNPA